LKTRTPRFYGGDDDAPTDLVGGFQGPFRGTGGEEKDEQGRDGGRKGGKRRREGRGKVTSAGVLGDLAKACTGSECLIVTATYSVHHQ